LKQNIKITKTLHKINFMFIFSAITLPMNMKCMEENYKLAKPVSQFVLPLCMTIHMAGATMNYLIGVIFVAQMNGIVVSFYQMITLWYSISNLIYIY